MSDYADRQRCQIEQFPGFLLQLCCFSLNLTTLQYRHHAVSKLKPFTVGIEEKL